MAPEGVGYVNDVFGSGASLENLFWIDSDAAAEQVVCEERVQKRFSKLALSALGKLIPWRGEVV